MMVINFPEANLELGKPEGWTDEQCASIPAYSGVNQEGKHIFLTLWQPNKEDKEAIAAGRPIVLVYASQFFPPTDMYTLNENNERNDL